MLYNSLNQNLQDKTNWDMTMEHITNINIDFLLCQIIKHSYFVKMLFILTKKFTKNISFMDIN